MTNRTNTIDESEIKKFSSIAHDWWNKSGEFKPLHAMNLVRLEYITDKIISHLRKIAGTEILDVGCGGGLASIPLARLGAKVTGIDASSENIEAATQESIRQNVDVIFKNELLENIAEKFDVVISLEVLEHVADVPKFLELLGSRLKPDGILIISTINRTIKSYALAVIAAEYILRWVKPGTHDFNKFIKPSEIYAELKKHGFMITNITGMEYSPISAEWKLSNNIDVNYIMTSSKRTI